MKPFFSTRIHLVQHLETIVHATEKNLASDPLDLPNTNNSDYGLRLRGLDL